MMKLKNNLTNGILIGISVIVLPLVLMSTTYTNTEKEVGRYQTSTCSDGNKIFELIIDTKTGDVVSRTKKMKIKYKGL